jgi:CRP-like cAMP-binding protein
MAVLYDLPRAADATAISACRLLAIDGRQFMRVMGRSLEGLQAMLKLTTRRLHTTTQRVLDAVALPATARLAKALVQLAELQCPAVCDGARIDLQMSQSELGGMTGLTRESVNKQLAVLRDAGWISQCGGSVTLLDVRALDAASSNCGEVVDIRWDPVGSPRLMGASARLASSSPGSSRARADRPRASSVGR